MIFLLLILANTLIMLIMFITKLNKGDNTEAAVTRCSLEQLL